MSLRSASPLFAWPLLAVYACVTSLGYGLHELAGVHHHGGDHSGDSHSVCSCSDCPYDHNASAEPREEAPAEPTLVAESKVENCDGCSICSLLSLARVLEQPVEVPVAFWSAPHELPASEVAEPLRLALQHPARGPPALA